MADPQLIIPNAREADVGGAVLVLGEAVLDTDARVLRVGDGARPGGLVLAEQSAVLEATEGAVQAAQAASQAASDATAAEATRAQQAEAALSGAIAATNGHLAATDQRVSTAEGRLDGHDNALATERQRALAAEAGLSDRVAGVDARTGELEVNRDQTNAHLAATDDRLTAAGQAAAAATATASQASTDATFAGGVAAIALDTTTQTQGRPGDAARRFTTTLTGNGHDGAAVPGVAAVSASGGAVLRITGAAVVATRERIALEPGGAYRLRWIHERHADPSDPAGAGVEAAIQWLAADKSALGAPQVIQEVALTVAMGVQQVSTLVVGPDADATAAAIRWPAAARYMVPCLRTYDVDAVTDVQAIGWQDVGAVEADLAATRGAVQPLPAMSAPNFRFDPAYPIPAWVLGDAPAVAAADAVFQAHGYPLAVTRPAGAAFYQRIPTDRPVLPGEWIAARILVAIDDPARWGDLDGRVATNLSADGGDYGSSTAIIWSTVNAPDYEVIDDHHRYLVQLFQNTLGVPVTGLYAFINLTGRQANLKTGGFVIAAARAEPVGVTDVDADPDLRAEWTARFAALAADSGTPPIVPMFTNFMLDPALPMPTDAFGGGAVVTHPVTDAVLAARGYLQQLGGEAAYQRVVLPRVVHPGEWLIVEALVAVDDAAKWPELNGRVATRLCVAAGTSYGDAAGREHIWNISDPAFHDEIDATHRVIRQTIQVTDGQPVAALIQQINTGGLDVVVTAGGWAVGASAVEPAGLELGANDPLGVAALGARVTALAAEVGSGGGAAAGALSISLSGDSLTDGTGASAGHTVTERLAYYLGGTSSHLGVPGGWAQCVVDRECGVPLLFQDNKLPAAGSATVVSFHGLDRLYAATDQTPLTSAGGNPAPETDTTPRWTQQPLTSPARADAASWPCSVMGVRGVLHRTAASDLSSESYEFTYPPLPADMDLPLYNIPVMAQPIAPHADIRGIWAGTNGKNNYRTWAAGIARFLEAGDGHRFAMGPLNATNEVSPQGNYYNVRVGVGLLAGYDISSGVSEVGGAHERFIDIQADLVRWGLVAAGLQPSAADLARMTSGATSDQLHSDATHLNDPGYDAVAQICVCHFLDWGWVTTDGLAHVPPLWASWSA